MPQILGWAAHRREEKVTSPFKGQIAAITVPLVAPSCNHYVKHTRKGRHYVTSEATAFKEALRLYARRQTVRGKAYKVEILHLYKRRDPANPRTELVVEAIE